MGRGRPREWYDRHKGVDADLTTRVAQVPASLPGIKLAPSAIPVNMGSHSKIFATPIAMTEEQIEEVIGMFVTTATPGD